VGPVSSSELNFFVVVVTNIEKISGKLATCRPYLALFLLACIDNLLCSDTVCNVTNMHCDTVLSFEHSSENI